MNYKRYDIFWVDLEPVRGSEMRKTRPAVIVSFDILNKALKTVVICPLTTTLHPTWRSRLQICTGGKTAEVAADQIRTVSKQRLGDKMGSLSDAEAETLRKLLGEMYA